MGWETIKEYTKDCGCECKDAKNDVDRPFMCYTEWETFVTKRCETHLQEYNENCAKEEERKKRKRQIREEQLQSLTSYLHDVMDVEHKQYIPIKEAVTKYKQVSKTNMSDRWIREDIQGKFGDVLMIHKIKNRWVCSKERLEYSDFTFLLKFSDGDIHDCLNSKSKPI